MARFNEPTLRLVLRHLTMMYEDEGRGRALEHHEFYSVQVVDLLVALDGHMSESIAAIRLMESRGWIRITRRAGEGAGFTHFVLTPAGYREGNPEKHDGGIAFTLRAIWKALVYALRSLGVMGGPLALANLLVEKSVWNSPYDWAVNFWDEKVSGPIKALLQMPLRYLDVWEVPDWIADYVALGILVAAASFRSGSPWGDLVNFMPPRVIWWRRALRFTVMLPKFLLGLVIFVLIWPYTVGFEIFLFFGLGYQYLFRRHLLDTHTKTFLPPRELLSRFVLFILPVLLFLGMLFLNALS